VSAVLRVVAPPLFDPALLVFEEEHHRYTYNGVHMRSVTQVLEGLHSFANVPWEILEAACERGDHVHLATQYHDEDDLDEATLRPNVLPYLAAWKKFCLDCQPKWHAIEKPLVHPVLMYAGTPDRFCELTVKRRFLPEAQIDIKTGLDAHPCWGIQTVAYNHLYGVPNAPRFTCQLRPDGTYRLLPWADPQDWPVFMSLLTIHTWKERNKL
jgi:hypothetical protein